MRHWSRDDRPSTPPGTRSAVNAPMRGSVAFVVDGQRRVVFSSGGTWPGQSQARRGTEVQDWLGDGVASTLDAALADARGERTWIVRDIEQAVPGRSQGRAVRLMVHPITDVHEGPEGSEHGFHPEAFVLLQEVERDLVADLEAQLRDTRDLLHRTLSSLETLARARPEASLAAPRPEFSQVVRTVPRNGPQRAVHEALGHVGSELAAVLEATRVAAIFLDDELNVRGFTPSISCIFNLLPTDIGRSLTHITHNAHEMPMLPAPSTLADDDAQAAAETIVRTIDGRWFVRRVIPYRPHGRDRDGLVVTFTDVTEARDSQTLAETRLAELQSIYGSVPIGLGFVDANRHFRSMNDTLADLFETRPSACVGHHITQALPPSCRAAFDHHVARCIERGLPTTDVELENPPVSGSETERAWLFGFQPVRDSSGTVIGVSIAARDVTERRRVERRMATEHAIARILTTPMDIDEALQRAVEGCRVSLDVDLGELWLCDDKTGTLRCRRTFVRRGLEHVLQPFVEQSQTVALGEGAGLPGVVWHRQETVWVDGIGRHPWFLRTEQATRCGLSTAFAFPVLLDRECLAVMAFYGQRRRRHDSALVQMLSATGRHIGHYVHRMRTERALQERTRTLQTINRINLNLAAQLELERIVQDVTDAATELCGAQLGAFFLCVDDDDERDATGKPRDLDGASLAAVPYAVSGVARDALTVAPMLNDNGLHAVMLRGEGIVRVDDLTRAEALRGQSTAPLSGLPDSLAMPRSYLAVPIVSRSGRVLGGLVFMHTTAAAFDDRSEDIVASIAAQAAVAIDNARLYQAAQRELIERQQLLSRQKQTEIRLQEALAAAAAANEAKSQFLANMSHEIRTPMTAILGYGEILVRQLDDPDNIACVETIQRNGKHLLEIINDILDLSKIEAGKLQIENAPMALIELLEDVRRLMSVRACERGLKLDIVYATAVPETIASNQTRLRQVLLNLVGNAIKFTDSGRVSVVARLLGHNASADDGVDDEPRHAPRLEVSVVDTGSGMTPAQVVRAFEPFTQGDSSVTRTHGGTGLGLTICRRLVESLGGAMTVDSEPGRGSRFTFWIPTGPLDGVRLQRPTHRRITLSSIPIVPRVDLAGLDILVADDHRDVRSLVKRHLESAGAHVVDVGDGSAALAELEAEEAAFDAVVLDMQMPVVDGYQTATRLRERGLRMPIIAVTAAAMKGDRERCLDAGCDAYLSKPVEGRQLVECIKRLLFAAAANDDMQSSPSQPRVPSPRRNPDLEDESTVTLDEVLTPAGEDAPQAHDRRLPRVLVVDDNDASAESTAMLLEMSGYETRTANDGESALVIAAELVPDAVLLDLSLPDISGFEVLERMRQMETLSQTRILAFSGRALDEDRQASLAAGFDDHIVKPVDIDHLISVLPSTSD